MITLCSDFGATSWYMGDTRRWDVSPPDDFYICNFRKSDDVWWIGVFIHYGYTGCYRIKSMVGGRNQISN